MPIRNILVPIAPRLPETSLLSTEDSEQRISAVEAEACASFNLWRRHNTRAAQHICVRAGAGGTARGSRVGFVWRLLPMNWRLFAVALPTLLAISLPGSSLLWIGLPQERSVYRENLGLPFRTRPATRVNLALGWRSP